MSVSRLSFSDYYHSNQFKNELTLPEHSGFHHFRYQLFENNRYRRIKDVINSKATLEKTIIKTIPKNIFFTPVKWLDSVNLRRRKDNQVKDYLISSPLYFDIDSNGKIEKATESAIALTDYIFKNNGRKPDWIVFSGRRGFHIYYWEWDKISRIEGSADKRISEFKKSREDIVAKICDEGIIVDRSVTSDPWRVLRVPGTLHGETGLIALKITDLTSFSVEKAQIIS